MEPFPRGFGREVFAELASANGECCRADFALFFSNKLISLTIFSWHGVCKGKPDPAAWESVRIDRRVAAWEGRQPPLGSTWMDNALLIGLSRQTALRRELDIVANNIANLNTTGFKADGAVFAEYLQNNARTQQFAAPDRRLSFVQDRMTWHDISQGTVQQTGNPLDVAIDGDGMLVVQTATRRALHPQRRAADQRRRRARHQHRRQGDRRRRRRSSCRPPTATSSSPRTARSRCARA